jgi:hypothetical protein
MSQRRCSSSVSFSSTCSSFSSTTPLLSSPLHIDEQQQSLINFTAFGRVRSSSSSPKSSNSSFLLTSDSNTTISSSSTISFCWPLIRPNYKRSRSVRHFNQNNFHERTPHFPSLVKLFSLSCSPCVFGSTLHSHSQTTLTSQSIISTQNDNTNQSTSCSCQNQSSSPKSNGVLQSINVQEKKRKKNENDSSNSKNNLVQRGWRNRVFVSDVLLIFLLQFTWILPYIFVSFLYTFKI